MSEREHGEGLSALVWPQRADSTLIPQRPVYDVIICFQPVLFAQCDERDEGQVSLEDISIFV